MTTKEKQGFGLYFLLAFGLAWLCQVGGCMVLLQKQNAVLYQLALVATMLCPLLAVLLVQKVFLRQPTGIGWKVQGKRRYWLAAWFGPAVFTVQAAGKTAPQLHCSCGGKSGRVLSRKYSGFQDLRRVSQTAAASMGSIPIRPMGAGPNTL